MGVVSYTASVCGLWVGFQSEVEIRDIGAVGAAGRMALGAIVSINMNGSGHQNAADGGNICMSTFRIQGLPHLDLQSIELSTDNDGLIPVRNELECSYEVADECNWVHEYCDGSLNDRHDAGILEGRFFDSRSLKDVFDTSTLLLVSSNVRDHLPSVSVVT